MINRKTMIAMGALAVLCAVCPEVVRGAQAQPNRVDADAGSAIEIEKKAQDKLDAWDEERAGMQEQIRSLKIKNAWLSFQVEKYSRYSEKQQDAIAELERRHEEMRTLGMELEPYLHQTLQSLSRQVSEDAPFLSEERQRRLKFLQDSLHDYHVSLSEKLRRVLEALQVEAGYGRTIDVAETELDLNGTLVRVNLLQLGRTALLYQGLDAEESGRWNTQTCVWEKIPSRFGPVIGRALDMARHRRAMELLDLPIGPLEQ